jgi:hypothetical protein
VVSAQPSAGSDYSSSLETSLVIADANDTATLDIRLTSPNISGTVLDATGTTPVEGAHVNVRNDASGFFAGVQTDDAGRFRLFAPQGTYQLQADPPSGSSEAASEEMNIVVQSDGTGPTDLEVTLANPNVTGVVLKPGTSTERVGNAHVSIHTTDWSTHVDAQADDEVTTSSPRIRLSETPNMEGRSTCP